MPKHKYYLQGSISRGPTSAAIEFRLPVREGAWIFDGAETEAVRRHVQKWFDDGYIVVDNPEGEVIVGDIYPVNNLIQVTILRGEAEDTGLPVAMAKGF